MPTMAQRVRCQLLSSTRSRGCTGAFEPAVGSIMSVIACHAIGTRPVEKPQRLRLTVLCRFDRLGDAHAQPEAAAMKIVIPDDYQDAVHRLACFDLLQGHDVVRYREP